MGRNFPEFQKIAKFFFAAAKCSASGCCTYSAHRMIETLEIKSLLIEFSTFDCQIFHEQQLMISTQRVGLCAL